MKRMFGPDDATPLVSFSGRPENCPNLGVGFSACLEVGRNSSGSKLKSMRVLHPFGLVPPAVGLASKPLPRAIGGFPTTGRCCWLLSGVFAGCSWLLCFRRCCRNSRVSAAEAAEPGCFSLDDQRRLRRLVAELT